MHYLILHVFKWYIVSVEIFWCTYTLQGIMSSSIHAFATCVQINIFVTINVIADYPL
jgi:hypothetical protein